MYTRRACLHVVVFVSFLLIAACGGGGGGGGGTSDFSVTLDQSSIIFDQYEGDSPISQTITGSIHGTYNGTLYAGAIVENTGATNAINPNIPIVINATHASAVITPASNLSAGTYTGRVLFLACSDQACNNRIGGTPLAVSFTVNVLAPVRASPSSLTRTVVSGTTVVQDVVVTPAAGQSSFAIGDPTNGSFVQVSNQSSSGFRVTLPSLPVGIYTSTIALASPNGGRSIFPISYTVTAPAGGEHGLLVGPPNSLTFTAAEGATSSAQVVPVTQPSWLPGLQQPLVQYSQGQNWLEVTPVSNGYSVTANASQLSAGTYTAYLVVQSNPVPVSTSLTQSQAIPISLTVGSGLVRPADISRIIEAETTLADLNGTVDIDLADGPQATWSAISSATWLTVSPSGLTGAPMTYHIDPTFLASAGNFTQNIASVTISVPGSPHTPVTFDISVSPRFPEVSGVGAHVQVAGQAATLVVAGRGFAAIANPAGRISVAGNTPTSVERIHDGKLLLAFSGLSPGTHEVSVNNALGISTRSSDVIAVTPNAHAYTAVVTGTHVQSLVMNHQTETLYGVRRSSIGLLTYGDLLVARQGGAGWTVDSYAVEGLENVGVQRDGDVVVKTTSAIRVLDRVTLSEKFSLDLACTGVDFLSQGGIPVTLDGRVWLSQSYSPDCQGYPRWGKVGVFEPVTREFNASPFAGNQTLEESFANGPNFLMSRDGERLIIHSLEIMGGSSVAYLDTSEFIPKFFTFTDTTDVILARPWHTTASISDDGHRMLFDSDRVLDEQFNIVGRLSIPGAPFVSASVISPDGTRVYVLTSRNDLTQSYTPRVYVLDISGDVGNAAVPVLGYFELPDYPSCFYDEATCYLHFPAAISLDGETLYFAGPEKLIVTPIPSVLQTTNAGNTNATGASNVRLWRSSVAQ